MGGGDCIKHCLGGSQGMALIGILSFKVEVKSHLELYFFLKLRGEAGVFGWEATPAAPLELNPVNSTLLSIPCGSCFLIVRHPSFRVYQTPCLWLPDIIPG